MSRPSLIGAGFISLASLFPRLGRRMWRWWYNALARRDDRHNLLFMNYGYSGEHCCPHLDERDEHYRLPIQLYQHVIDQVSLPNKQVIEIGCGRGGGAAWIARYHKPAKLTGIDLADEAIYRCRSLHTEKNLWFEQGSADNLPMHADSVDVVINVESSHCYPDIPAYLSEVQRVLVPGGRFCWCDFRSPGSMQKFRQQVADSGLAITSEHDITANVLAALDQMSEERASGISNNVPALLRRVFRDFAGVQSTAVYDMLKKGRLSYYSLQARKKA